MPKGKRYRVTLEGIIYDLSPGQFELLSKKSFKLKKLDEFDWKYQQRINGLVGKGLFYKKNGSYQRTNLGTEVYKTLVAKS